MTKMHTINPNLDGLCYILLKPDVVLRNVTSSILKYFEDMGLTILDFRCGTVSDVIYNKMYQESFLWRLDFWSHNAQAYKYGPSVGLLLWDGVISTRQMPSQTYLYKVKGKTLPEDLLPGTIRYIFGSTSRVFNVLHVPETSFQAMEEAKLWFGEEFMGRFVEHAFIAQIPLEQEKHYVISNEIKNHGYFSDRWLHGYVSFLYSKIRLFHSIRKSMFCSESILNIFSNLEKHYLSLAKYLSQNLDKKQEINYLNNVRRRENLLLKELKLSGVDLLSQIAEVLLDLNTKKVKLLILDYFWQICSAQRVYISDLEKYIITTDLIYPTINHENE